MRVDEQLGAHLAHNQEYVSSSLAPATDNRACYIIACPIIFLYVKNYTKIVVFVIFVGGAT